MPIKETGASFLVRSRTAATSIEAAVEINVPTGPLVQYALVGGVFEERATDTLQARIDLALDGATPPFSSEIASDRAAIFCGIPREYLPGIVTGIDLHLREAGFSGGLLTVNVGAHSLCGSSIVAFRRATRMLMRLFISRSDDVGL